MSSFDSRISAHPSTGLPISYRINAKENSIEPGPLVSGKDWDQVFQLMNAQGITGLKAGEWITDAGLERLAELPQLQQLNVCGSHGRITDRGLAVLHHLPELRRFQISWQPNISDAGVSHLAGCEHLESVDLLGTPTGDGAIQALIGKGKLSRFKSGRHVTDGGLALLQGFPVFRTWQGGGICCSLMNADAEPNHLLLEGPFTDQGIASLAGLDGLFALSFFWHCPAFTAAGLKTLRDLANLGFLGCPAEHCDDAAMRHIAAIPKLRMLLAQGAVAGDAGFMELSRSQTLAYIWGRECPNLTGRGFAALAGMPALRGLAVSCKNVDDDTLSSLPRFPALREFMPMDVPDEGFRHVGRCEQLEALWCMYCRTTGDIATGHIAALPALKTYYAGKTTITDRSLEILSRMASLERLEFWQCAGITSAGVSLLAALPRLREIKFEGMPGVSTEALAGFSERVQVTYSET